MAVGLEVEEATVIVAVWTGVLETALLLFETTVLAFEFDADAEDDATEIDDVWATAGVGMTTVLVYAFP